MLGLLSSPQVAERARLRLQPVLSTADGRRRLEEAATWLDANGAWDPAGRALGMHRHTLKLRIEQLGEELGLPVDEFRGRAELYALLVAGGFSGGRG